MEWINCNAELPMQTKMGLGKYSVVVEVLLSDGTRSKDWLINDKWTIHCKNNGGAYPIKWRYFNEFQG